MTGPRSIELKVSGYDPGSHCHAQNDGDCTWDACPQMRDGEPEKTGRTCPLPLGERHE
jgi:hypothetical protein